MSITKTVGRWKVELQNDGWPSWVAIKDCDSGNALTSLSIEEIRDLHFALQRVLDTDYQNREERKRHD